MKIKTESGDIIDLAEYRRSLEACRETSGSTVGFARRIAILDALEAVLAIPVVKGAIVFGREFAEQRAYDAGCEDGWAVHSEAVRAAAGVIEA